MNSCRLEMLESLWVGLISDLRLRGGGVRESGAFLLGDIKSNARVARAWVPYDVLDPNALTEGYVCLSTAAFTRLWKVCFECGMTVVADIHTHPKGARQSCSDRLNPMISQAGHIALIAPRYAQGKVMPIDLSVNVYLGDKKWSSFCGQDAQRRIHLL